MNTTLNEILEKSFKLKDWFMRIPTRAEKQNKNRVSKVMGKIVSRTKIDLAQGLVMYVPCVVDDDSCAGLKIEAANGFIKLYLYF